MSKDAIPPKIGLVILAAGSSSRMGQPKQLLPFQGESLIRHCIETALQSRCFPIVVVLGANWEVIQLEIEDLPVFTVTNTDWEAGMASSIRLGLQTLLKNAESIEAAIFMLCDQPFVSAKLLNKLMVEYLQDQKSIVASGYGKTLGVPSLFDRQLFDELLNLQGQEGARTLIKAYAEEVHCVSFPEGSIDIDTPEDYLKWCQTPDATE